MKEKLQTRQMWKWLLVIAVLLAGVLGMSMHAQAATKKYPPELKAGKTYSTKLTGSKTYKVKWTNNYDSKKGVNYVRVYVDNKNVKTIKNKLDFAEVLLLKVSKNRNMLGIHMWSDGPHKFGIYEYKGGQFKLLFSADDRKEGHWCGKSYEGFTLPYNIGNNQFTMDYWYYWWSEDTYMSYTPSITYKVGSDKITKIGSIFPVEKQTHVLARKITAYKTADSKEVVFTAQKGSKITLLKMAERKGATYLKVQNEKGKAGWFKAASEVKYFKSVSAY